MDARFEIPAAFQADIHSATEILRASGCTDIHVFSSLQKGCSDESSHLDLAVRECPKVGFVHLWGELCMTLDHLVDQVDLSSEDPFVHALQTHAELLREIRHHAPS